MDAPALLRMRLNSPPVVSVIPRTKFLVWTVRALLYDQTDVLYQPCGHSAVIDLRNVQVQEIDATAGWRGNDRRGSTWNWDIPVLSAKVRVTEALSAHPIPLAGCTSERSGHRLPLKCMSL